MARSKRRRVEEEEEDVEDEVPPSDPEELVETQQQQDEEEAEDEGPSSKRQRSEYPRGTVKKVKVFNFMTYGTPAVEIKPGPRLNLVLGPNGTGKSSLVCALCLGLTGAPKLLGRADNLKDFIQRGADNGWVETTLSGGPGRPDKVIRCEMRKTAEGYSTNWRINGASKPMRDVKELVKEMNIQFDNLCQFLPQDKVVEFARLNPYELLIATEKAIGDSSLYDTHMQLIAKRDAMKQREQVRGHEQASHDQLVDQNQKLEREYQRFEKKQKLIKSIKVLKKKLAWMAVKEAQERAKAADDEEKEKHRQLTEARRAAKGDERPAKQREQAAAAARQQTSVLLQEYKKQEGRVRKAMDKAAAEEQQVRQLRDQVNGLAAESKKRQHNIDVLRKKMQQVQQALDNFGPIPDHTAQIRQLTEQQNELREQIGSLETDKLATMDELRQVEIQKNQKEGVLREVASASWRRMEAIISTQGRIQGRNLEALRGFSQWVGQQRAAGAFRGQVVGPLGVEVKLRGSVNGQPLSPAWVANLEQAVWSQLANFAVQTRDDERLLMDELSRVGLHTIKVVVVTQDLNTAIGSETAALADYGVVASLNELFDAPPLVRHALNNVCMLDSTYVMAGHDLDRAKAMMQGHRGVKRVYTPEEVLSYVRSAYGSAADAHVKTDSLMPGKILGVTGANADVDERKRVLEQQLADIGRRLSDLQEAQRLAEGSLAPLQAQVEELQGQIRDLQADTNKKSAERRRLLNGMKQAERLLADREAAPEPLKQAPQLEAKIKAALKRHHAAVSEALAGNIESWKVLQQHVAAELSMRELDMQAKAMLSHFEDQRRAVSVLEGEHRAAVSRAKALTDAFRRAKEAAEEEHPLDAAARQAFTELSDDREELAQDLSELEENVDNITVSNPRVAQEYRTRKEQIESKAKLLADLQAQLDADSQELDLLKTQWLPELQRVVDLINTSFSNNFSEIGCAGEVHLQEDEDYDKYCIQIKVKFREEEALQQLTAHRQSGGERSVSTILYLIALQGVTVTPFRVVDEINQGMDPANERKVFEQLVAASCREGTPQCFLLTPKLLPDLPFTEDITVLNIFNGALIAEQVATNWSKSKMFGSSSMQQLQQLGAVPVAG